MRYPFLSFLGTLLLLGSCTSTQNTAVKGKAQGIEVPIETSEQAAQKYTNFRDYWYRGLAEMNRYEMKKGRYQDSHDGEAVLVFVTEPFLKDKQVKHESGDGANATDVLKLNASERFYTGVYPYSILTSIFSPIDGTDTIKMMSTVQEWCGAVWVQLNQNEEGYRARSFSYFQSEGDRDFQLPEASYEDTLWTTIRLDPSKLPLGEIQVVPALTYLRLSHRPSQPYAASAKLETDQKSPYANGKVNIYTLEYPELNRVMTIHFEPTFPYRIVGFDEVKKSVFGGDVRTTAKLTNSIMLDYWSKHDVAHAPYRDALGLEH